MSDNAGSREILCADFVNKLHFTTMKCSFVFNYMHFQSEYDVVKMKVPQGSILD